MKKNLFYIFLLMAVAVMPLTSCNKDNDPQVDEQHDPESDSDQRQITAYDALSWLQGNIVVVDGKNEIIRRILGKALDESQPDVISIPVLDYGEAEKIFLGWVAPDKEAIKVDGGYDYNLTDAEGNAQGSVSFRAVDGADGAVACMTVAEGTGLKLVSEVRFIDAGLWPENDETLEVKAGEIYELEDYVLSWSGSLTLTFNKPELKSLPFYCIQGNTEGKEGILVWLSPDSDTKLDHPNPYYYYATEAHNYLPTEPVAEKVVEFFNNNYAFWNNMLAEMDLRGLKWSPQDGTGTTGNCEFMLNETYGKGDILCMDLDKDGKGGLVWVDNSPYRYRYMHIRIIPPVGNSGPAESPDTTEQLGDIKDEIDW